MTPDPIKAQLIQKLHELQPGRYNREALVNLPSDVLHNEIQLLLSQECLLEGGPFSGSKVYQPIEVVELELHHDDKMNLYVRDGRTFKYQS